MVSRNHGLPTPSTNNHANHVITFLNIDGPQVHEASSVLTTATPRDTGITPPALGQSRLLRVLRAGAVNGSPGRAQASQVLPTPAVAGGRTLPRTLPRRTLPAKAWIQTLYKQPIYMKRINRTGTRGAPLRSPFTPGDNHVINTFSHTLQFFGVARRPATVAPRKIQTASARAGLRRISRGPRRHGNRRETPITMTCAPLLWRWLSQ